MGSAYIIWIIIAICFIIMISVSIYNFIRIGNLQNSSVALEISLKNESESKDKQYNESIMSNISQLKLDLRKDIKSNMDHITKEQHDVDSQQDTLISKNVNDIVNVNSNITYDINPKLLDFDGNFKSLEGSLVSNKDGIDSLSKSITQLSSQYTTQHLQLSEDIKKINEMQFEDKIGTLQQQQTKIKEEVSGINVNKQSIANNKVTISDNLKDITTMSGNFLTLSKSTLGLANIVDTHDLVIKTIN